MITVLKKIKIELKIMKKIKAIIKIKKNVKKINIQLKIYLGK